MKNKKKNKNTNQLSMIKIVLSVIVFLIVLVLINWKYNTSNIKINKAIFLQNNGEELDIETGYVFKGYDSFKELTNSDALKRKDFQKYNFAVATVIWDGCGEDNIEIEGYDIKDNTIHFKYTYEADCGLCAPIYDYYLIPVTKDKKDIEVKVEGKARNKVECDPFVSYKPMIYLYPTKKTNVTVLLGYPELLTTTYPKYLDKWQVTAYPNGDLVDKNNKTYYGLYWEGLNNISTNFEDGFVVKKDNIISFLEEKLNILGLNEREANEFIVYWLPILEQNDYNLIRFATLDEINDQMPLDINPRPDSLIRVLMEFKPLEQNITVKEQLLTTPQRTGFTVVEWGGTIMN